MTTQLTQTLRPLAADSQNTTNHISTLGADGSDRVCIRRPDAPQHLMLLSRAHPSATATAGAMLAVSDSAVVVEEVGRTRYAPVVYFPRRDVHARLVLSPKRTYCPLKGTASYYDVISPSGERLIEAAWSYEEVRDFDAHLELLRQKVAFDASLVRVAA